MKVIFVFPTICFFFNKFSVAAAAGDDFDGGLETLALSSPAIDDDAR